MPYDAATHVSDPPSAVSRADLLPDLTPCEEFEPRHMNWLDWIRSFEAMADGNHSIFKPRTILIAALVFFPALAVSVGLALVMGSLF